MINNMNYTEALQYIKEIPWTSRKPGLHRIKALLEALGRPDKDLKFIHVAGTNGKGSVCAMLDAVLRTAGYRVGFFTSPHLIKYNERMKVNGQEIGDEDFAAVISEVDTAAKKLLSPDNAISDQEEFESPSEFEILTAAGMLYFKQQKCDIVILEVGLGGEFDSTNVIEDKELAVITPIGFDHMAILGNTLPEIASAKAGIIKENCHVVCALQAALGKNVLDFAGCPAYKVESGLQNREVMEVFRNKCLETGAKLHIPTLTRFKKISSGIDGQVFSSAYSDKPLTLGLLGDYQLTNALTVLEAAKVLRENGWDIPEEAVSSGLKNVRWAARFEVLNRKPVFILDGAHNEHGINAAVDSLMSLFPGKKIKYILGILSDKNIDAMLSKLYTNADCFITLTPESSRALAGESLAERLRNDGYKAVNFDTPKEAVEHALKNASEDDVICSLGSLYLAGNIRDCFKVNP